MTLPYKPTSWTDNEVLSTDKLNQMTNNDQWIYENTPRTKYVGNGTKTSGVKILATRALVTPRNSIAGTTDLYFGAFFSTGCQPIITCTVTPTGWQRRFFVSVHSLTGTTVPDHTGCRIHVSSGEITPAHQKILANVYIQVQAIGW